MRLLTIAEASERLGLKPATMRSWIWTRKIEHVHVGRGRETARGYDFTTH
jgi:excisionase family DNA binding protein